MKATVIKCGTPRRVGSTTLETSFGFDECSMPAPEVVPEIALEPDNDIIIVTPGHKNKVDNPNEPSGESVDDDNLINIGDDDDEEKMPKLIPQTNEDSDSEDEDDEDSDSENDKGPVTGRTSSG
jgi:hypothetical protein